MECWRKGTWVNSDFDVVTSHVRQDPDRFVIGVDSLGGRIAIRGWTQTTEETTLSFSKRLKSAGVRRVLFTEVERDGLMQGAAVDNTAALARDAGIEVIASGGVSDLDDIRALSQCPG